VSFSKRLFALISVFVLCGLFLAPPLQAAEPPESLTIAGGPASATDTTPVDLDADLYLPKTVPAPAVVLAHGFGGDKSGGADQAGRLAAAGFVVLTYSARGFGESTGLISMNSPDFEVADASKLIDFLSERPEVTQDAEGDPRVGFAGGSYGGAKVTLELGSQVGLMAAPLRYLLPVTTTVLMPSPRTSRGTTLRPHCSVRVSTVQPNWVCTKICGPDSFSVSVCETPTGR